MFFSYKRRKRQGKIPYVKSSELPEREKKKHREKWKAASSAYRKREKMAKAVLDLTPPSIENIPPVDVDLAQEQPENAGQAVVDSIPEDFNPPVSSTPERDQRSKTSSAEKCCKRLHKEIDKLQKQVFHQRKQLAEMRKLNDKFSKREKRLMARQRVGLSEKFKQRGSKKLSADRKHAVINFVVC